MRKANFCYAVLAASSILALGSAFTASAAEWKMVNSEWMYIQNDGEPLRDSWKQDGNLYYYLGSDGYMVRNTLLEDDDNYYYLNSAGVMTANDWKYIQNPEWQGDSLAGDGSWYYFGANGKAIRSDGEKAKVYDVGDKKFVFDSFGRMMTGWVTEAGEAVEHEEDWPSAMYYANGEGDGSVVTNAWVYISVPDPDNEEDNEPTYHFYFNSNGKKAVSTDKTIANKQYHFDERGVALYGWVKDEDGDDDGDLWKYYGDSEEPYLRTGWFQAVPGSEMNPGAHDEGSMRWYYATNNGKIYTKTLRTIDSKQYAFNSVGELVTGLKIIHYEDKQLSDIRDVNYASDVTDPLGENDYVVYFGSDGATKTGTQTITLDGTPYAFNFKSNGSPRGAGINGISDNKIYMNGLVLSAESGSKYQTAEYDGKSYVVNESGTIQKGKKNLKDSDGYYFCTDKNGVVAHGGAQDEKCTEKSHPAE